jgi:hypothetical protein
VPQFDIVFEKLTELLTSVPEAQITVDLVPSPKELDEIDELRRFSAEIREPEALSFTTT